MIAYHFQTFELIEAMEKDAKFKIKEIKVDGGMINNDNFLQSISNITQIKIIKPKNIETTSLGVVYLAAINNNFIKNTNQIKKLWEKEKITRPKISKKDTRPLIYKWKKTIKLLISYF